jgi:hypothetical protein
MKELKNPEITQDTVLKLYKEKGCYNGFAWIGSKEIVGTNEIINTELKNSYYLLIFKHLFTDQIFGTPVRVTTAPGGIGYSPLIEKTTRLTDLE